jgi:hypothetical protein
MESCRLLPRTHILENMDSVTDRTTYSNPCLIEGGICQINVDERMAVVHALSGAITHIPRKSPYGAPRGGSGKAHRKISAGAIKLGAYASRR